MAPVPAPSAAGNPTGHALDLSDVSAVRAWIDVVCSNVNDLASAAEDQTLRPGKRRLGRKSAREIVEGARRALTASIAAARAGLPPVPPEDDGAPTDPDATPMPGGEP